MADDFKPDWTVSPQFTLLEAIPHCDWADFAKDAGLTRDEQIAIMIDGDISVSASKRIAAATDIQASIWRNMSQQYLAERKRLGKGVMEVPNDG